MKNLSLGGGNLNKELTIVVQRILVLVDLQIQVRHLQRMRQPDAMVVAKEDAPMAVMVAVKDLVQGIAKQRVLILVKAIAAARVLEVVVILAELHVALNVGLFVQIVVTCLVVHRANLVVKVGVMLLVHIIVNTIWDEKRGIVFTA